MAPVLLAITALFTFAAAQVPSPPPPPLTPPPAVPSAPPPAAVPPAPSTGNGGSCDPLKLRVCANLLNGLLGVHLPGGDSQCCPLLRGLVDLDAAVCLCTAIKANVLGIINFNVPLGLKNLLFNHCGKAVPDGFTCTRA